MRKFIAVFIAILLVFTNTISVFAKAMVLSDDIVILYTNDIHSYIDGPLSYDVISAIKKNLQKKYKYVFLVDAGDHIQGTVYGSMDKGESIIRMMNEAGYDIATLGNHEFDYGMEGCLNAISLAKFPYVSSNFHHMENGVNGENVLDSYKIFDCGDEKLAIIGITTPESISKSTPKYFQDENGSFIYEISGGDNGEELQADLQKAIDEAKAEGATKLIALGHLGIDPSSKPWTSEEAIEGISGLDVFIDGHSHSIVEEKIVKDKSENNVILTQTGEYFNRIGMMLINSETDEIKTDFIEYEEILANDGEAVEGYKLSSELYKETELIINDDVKKIKDEWIEKIDKKLGDKIGTTKLKLDNYDEEENRLVRVQETNSGDFVTDALYYLFDDMGLDVDVAIMNGGGIRNTAVTGELSYKTCKDMHTFGNVACLERVTGQQILDALEWGARFVGESEYGGFLQTSGLTYKIDTSIPNTVKEDEKGNWVNAPEKYRVYDVKVYNKKTNAYEPLELDSSYNLAGHNYTLRDLGDGYTMFNGAENILDYVMEDYMVLAYYIQGFKNGTIEAVNSPLLEKYPDMLLDYSRVEGSGRIEIAENPQEEIFDDEVWVAGVKVTEENKNDVLNDGGSVKYDPVTDTITLKDASIINDSGHGIYSYGINLTVNGIDTEAQGSNDISSNIVEEKGIDENGEEYILATPAYCIYSEGDGFSENGGLTITGTLGKLIAKESDGIFADGDIVIKGYIDDISCSGGISSGICNNFNSIIIEESGKIGNITSKEYNGISANGDIIIKGNVGNINGGGYAGLYAVGGDIIITGEVKSITGDEVGIEAYNKVVDWDNNGNEIYEIGNITINGKIGEVKGGSVGAYAEGNLNISGSVNIIATGEVEENARACSVGGEIKLSSEDIVLEPKAYQITKYLVDSYENDEGLVEIWQNVILNSNGEPALTAKFEGWVNPFKDVKDEDWYYKDIEYASMNKLLNGVTEDSFEPNAYLTRAMLVTILYRAEGEPIISNGFAFSDVDMSSYYSKAVFWAKQNNIISGTSETTFSPNENITREQIALIIYRYAKYKGYDVSIAESTNILSYKDYNKISEYAIPAIQYMVGSDLMKGKATSIINPKDNATRAEMTAILHRFIELNK